MIHFILIISKNIGILHLNIFGIILRFIPSIIKLFD
jgi:hypothetical protein